MPNKSLLQKPEYKEIFESGTKEGFNVTMARQYYQTDYRTQEPDPTRPMLEQMMETPYLYKDNPVFGYTVTDLSAKQSAVRGENLRPTITHEFHILDDQGTLHNVDDYIKSGETFKDKNTADDVTLSQAMDHMGKFASAASEYPHVFEYNEYMATRSYMNGRLGLAEPTPDDYSNYLDSVTKQLEQRIPFVGAVTKPSDMANFREYVGFPENDQPNQGVEAKTDYDK